jgi:oxepin-CoA hydrolase/3-oxo-5,6-dehydrosuberyl-CoA semialdehyde dehydrogenase
MIIVPFDVNNVKIRCDFLKRVLMEAINSITEQSQPLWGKMTAQDMIEHLTLTFELSTGKIEVHRNIPENLIERMKKFLYDNRPTPHDFKNPLLGENPPQLRFKSLADSKRALSEELSLFFDHFKEKEDAVHNHPIFGPLGAVEWERALFKHCYHHLLQFGLIIEAEPEVV